MILLGRLDPAELPDEWLISAVTLADLSVGPHATDDPAERAAGTRTSSRRRLTSPPLAFDAPAARAFGAVASLRRAGRKPAARAYDALIAATAVAEGSAALYLQTR